MKIGTGKSHKTTRKDRLFFVLFCVISRFHKPVLQISVLAFFSLVIFSGPAFAQDPPISDTAPPPLKILTKEELTQLKAVTDVKKRTKLSLELMETRLKKSEELHTSENYDEMFKQLGGFHALMDNTLEFLHKSDKDSGKVLNNFKRLELGLRRFIPRLELIRRDIPIRYELYLRNLAKYVREARTRAVEPLFDDTVLPTGKHEIIPNSQS